MSMRKTLFSIATALLCFTGCTSVPKTCEQPYEPIQIAVPERPAGQQDRHSYLLVAAGITPKALRQEIRNQIEKAGLPEE